MARDLGLRIPEDLAVISYDNTPLPCLAAALPDQRGSIGSLSWSKSDAASAGSHRWPYAIRAFHHSSYARDSRQLRGSAPSFTISPSGFRRSDNFLAQLDRSFQLKFTQTPWDRADRPLLIGPDLIRSISTNTWASAWVRRGGNDGAHPRSSRKSPSFSWTGRSEKQKAIASPSTARYLTRDQPGMDMMSFRERRT